ncbi:hypothetical protein CUMW_133300 [Citrus unshiu]|nr:hypothetical protein CUMW_133300 [Citrus unshiu]
MTPLRHTGQELEREIHVEIHVAWNTWPHGTCLPGNACRKFSMQTVQRPSVAATVGKLDTVNSLFVCPS